MLATFLTSIILHMVAMLGLYEAARVLVNANGVQNGLNWGAMCHQHFEPVAIPIW